MEKQRMQVSTRGRGLEPRGRTELVSANRHAVWPGEPLSPSLSLGLLLCTMGVSADGPRTPPA